MGIIPTTLWESFPHKKEPIKKEPKKKNTFADEDIGLVNFFYQSIKKINSAIPNKTDAQIQRWVKEMQDWRKKDNRSVEEVRKAIEYLLWEKDHSTSKFKWYGIIQSVEKLKLHYPSIYLQIMNPPPEIQKAKDDNKKVDNIKQNKQIAEKMIKENTSIDDLICKINDTGVQIKIGKAFTTLGFNVNGFEDQLKSNLRKAVYEKSRNTPL